MTNFKFTSMAAGLVFAAASLQGLAAQDKFVIKYATIAPKGTVLTKYISKMRREVQTKSGGRIKMKIYDGGKAGTENTMVKKLRLGSIHMASFTGIGLGKINPRVRFLELPFFFNNKGQVDRTVACFYDDFAKDFDKKGFVLAGWSELGWVYLMSKKPIRTFNDMKGQKIWAPVGDKLVKAMFEAYGFVPVYLSFEAVLPQLQTGGLDAVYAPPVGAIGLQWFREVGYLSNVKLANATGATLISKKKYKKLPPDLQKLLVDTSVKYNKLLIKAVRKENKRGLGILKRRGIKVISVNKADLATLKKRAKQVGNRLAGKLYSKADLARAKKCRK